jgi:hypothetical protein
MINLLEIGYDVFHAAGTAFYSQQSGHETGCCFETTKNEF